VKRDGIYTMADLKDRCRIDEITGCWIWGGAVYNNIASMWYGPMKTRMSVTGIMRYLMSDTPPPKNLHWYASCGNILCCNPKHRKLGTRATLQKTVLPANISQSHKLAISKGKRAKSVHYTPEKAAAIRGSDETCRVLAERYGLSIGMVHRVKIGDRWADQGSSAFTWRP